MKILDFIAGDLIGSFFCIPVPIFIVLNIKDGDLVTGVFLILLLAYIIHNIWWCGKWKEENFKQADKIELLERQLNRKQ